MNIFELSELLGNFGEFFGALLLFASLVYVGVQVRQNTAVSRAQIYQARADTMQEMFIFLAGSPELVGIYSAVMKNGKFV